MTKMGSYIQGRWIVPQSGTMIRNFNPAQLDELVAEFPAATEADTMRAIEAAKAASRSWAGIPAPERGRYLWRAANLARQRVDEIAASITREEGKIFAEARGEAIKGVNVLEFCAGEGFRMEGKTIPSEMPSTATYTLRQPIGVVGLICPWNFPWAIPCWKIAPALVAGNTIVFKPASATPLTAAILIEILEEAGLPPGVLNMVVGSGSVVGRAIVEHPAVKVLSFTGSNEIGSGLYCGGAQKGAKVTCEMGGKNPLVVLDDADLARAETAIVHGAFGSTGQRCTATSRVIVQSGVKGRLLEGLVDRAAALKIGNGMDPSVQMGPVVDDHQYRSVLRYLDLGKGEELKVLCGGGKASEAGNGFFIQPTIFDGVPPESRIFQEEVFGPVLAISEARDLDEAIALANAVQYGLTASIFTSHVGHAHRFIEEVRVGMVHVNEPTIGGEAQLPFGGVGATGVGEREMGHEGFNFFTELKTVFINYGGSAERALIR